MNRTPLPVVEYDPARHAEALFRFIEKVLGAPTCARRRQVIETMHAAMPGRDRAPIRHVLMDGERVAGTLGYMPADFWVNGKRVPARFTHDLLVDPDYRGGGLGKVIVGHALAQGDFFPGGMWMTDPCCRIHTEVGFRQAAPLTTYSLVLDPDAFIERRGTTLLRAMVGRVALRVNRALALGRAKRAASHSDIQVLERFDPAMDDMWRALAAGYGITRVRDAAYLNWKYTDHPWLGYRNLVAMRDGRPVGYLVWRLAPERTEERRAIVVDFLVAKEDASTLRGMVSRVVMDAAAAQMDTVSLLTTQPWAATALRKLCFLPRAARNTWVVAGWEGAIPEEWLTRSEAWHVCLGDSDGDIWTGSMQAD